MATALYRRYRPEAFSEMIGQAHVTEPLMTALRTGRIGHAYLFSGPRGCGKTTSARILARCLNCAEGPTDAPCGTCPSCIELSREGGGSLDVVEIDAASHGGVDDARELRERAVFAPARDRYKIFIIDEAHMVTSGGFNALLKIVEEPPPHVKFVFATTEPDKVIGTIRSRTHHYPFRLIAPGALIDYVQQLCDSEGVEVEPGVLPLVVRSGGGSVRDTLSILDQLIAGSEGSGVTLERATGLLGFTSAELLDDAVAALGAGDSARAFVATDQVVQTGQDPRRFVEDLLERLRDLIVIGATTVQGASAVFRGVPEDQLQLMFEQSRLFAPGQLSRIADTVSDALDRMTGATAPRLHLELMMARALVERVAGGRPQDAAAPASQQPVAPRQAAGAPSGGAQRPLRSGSAPGTGGAAAAPPAAVPSPAETPSAGAPAPTSAAAPQQPKAAPPSAPVPHAPDRPAAPGLSAPEVDVIATLKSAREFLNGGASEKSPMVPLGGHAPAAPTNAEAAGSPHSGQAQESRESPTAQEASAPAPAAGSAMPEPSESPAAPVEERVPAGTGDATPGIDELRELWPELLEELLEADRDAWNAVKNVQPLAFEGETLTVGMASRSDLEVFKSSGAGPLREVLVAAVGVSVKYVPRQLPAGSSGSTGAGSADAGSARVGSAGAAPPDEEPSPPAEPAPAPEPMPAGYDEPSADYEELPEDREPVPQTPGLGPAPGPGSALSPAPGPGPGSERTRAPEPRDLEPSASESAASEPAVPEPVVPEPAAPARTAPAQTAPERPSTVSFAVPGTTESQPVVEPQKSSRYGEAVVRELLGARFIEERPLPQNEE